MTNSGIDIRLILGLKVKELRTRKNLSFQELSKTAGLSVSYLNEIEKGKKYPKGDKIIRLSEALDVSYDYLVSLKVPRKIEPIITLLQSPFLREFPLEMLGLDSQKFVELISANPEKVNAFINTILQVARSYELGKENIYYAALRSFQEINENYFPDLEQSVSDFKQQFDFESLPTYSTEELSQVLKDYFNVVVSDELLSGKALLKDIRSHYDEDNRLLSLNKGLTTAQEKFLMMREVAFQYLKTEQRTTVTPPVGKHSFTQLLNNFKASYFAVAFLMDKDRMIRDIKGFVRANQWHDQDVLQILEKYDATPEMLMQRLTNILPHHFGFNNLFFLKMINRPGSDGYRLTKELHLSKLHSPYGNEMDEHYCRRWISVGIIDEFKEKGHRQPIARLQISKYYNTKNQYLCLSIANPNSSDSDEVMSLTVGFQIDKKLREGIDVLEDPKITEREVHTTCERCPIADCQERAAPPWKYEKQKKEAEIEKALEGLGSE
ncbi:MAG: XRE family transcriptional regulator [Cyclobacteriaceae bacterium]